MAEERRALIQSNPAGSTSSRMCVSVSMPRSPTSTTFESPNRRRSLSICTPTVMASAVSPSNTSTATRRPSRSHNSPNSI